jgi:hypothetical protein
MSDLGLDSGPPSEGNSLDYSYLTLFDVSKDFSDSWSLHLLPDFSSLSNSGPTGTKSVLLQLIHPNIPKFDKTSLLRFDEVGVCVQASVIRKLLMFLQIKEVLFTRLQNYILTEQGQFGSEHRCQMVTDAFFTSITSLTSKCVNDCRSLIAKCQPVGGCWRHRDVDRSQLTHYVLHHYHDRTEELNELTLISTSLGLPVWRTRTWIEKRWTCLDNFIAGTEKSPGWLPKNVPIEEIMELLTTGKPSINN